MELNHFSHREHPLILKESLQDVVECHGCKQPISLGSKTYCCTSSSCEFFLHKSCAESPIEFTHPKHRHPLQLFSRTPYYQLDSFWCHICYKDCNGFTYHCSKCRFDVDILCAQKEATFQYITIQKATSFKHSSHVHPLKLQEKRALFECDACGIKKEDESYDCTVCSFWIHKTCGSLPETSSLEDHPAHNHPLTLSYYFPEKYRSYELSCDICSEMLHLSRWVYYCAPCRYFVHLNCMNNKDAQANNEEITRADIITLPVDNLSEVLIKRFLERSGLPQVEPSTEIKHFNHEHPLILMSVKDDYYEFTEDEQETVCNACVEPISGSCYGCASSDQCNYFLHLYCAQLPSTLSCSLHPNHTLSLSSSNHFYNFFECRECKRLSNGFMYGCSHSGCDFRVDIRCALFPKDYAIKHNAHAHLLFQDASASSEVCRACNRSHCETFVSCKSCPYKMGRSCATLPKSVGHRWDKHRLTLSFPPFYYEFDKIMCDKCEKEIHPKQFLYHCRDQCDNVFHPHCIPRLGSNRNVKFGGKVKVGDHPHPLTFKRKAEYEDYSCHRCGVGLKGRIYFGCEPCYFTMCRKCVSIVMRRRE